MNKLALAVLLGSLALPAAAKDKFKLISADTLAAELKSPTPPALFDANNKTTRDEYGVIPGATLLSDIKKFDLKLLPADKAKAVVFYCANPKCMASHQAAKRAVKAGYKDVAVMSDGIMGWAKSGKAVDKPKS